MRLRVVVALVVLPLAASAAERPEWAFGSETPAPRSVTDPEAIITVPGSSKRYTAKQVDSFFDPPDWFPDEHPPMPQIVAHGREPAVRACITCHVTNGHGHPDNSRLPGASAAYLLRQLGDLQSGARKGGNMGPIAKAMTPEEMKTAADYFSQLKPIAWTKVVETDTVPKTRIGRGNRSNVIPGGGTEPIGDRIIEVPEDTARVDIRDPHAGFIAYVPIGSVAKGKELVTTGAGKTIPCSVCHGEGLRGLGDVPHLAGRSPSSIGRQLYYFQSGDRTGPAASLMKAPVEKLTSDDILAISAYVASLAP